MKNKKRITGFYNHLLEQGYAKQTARVSKNNVNTYLEWAAERKASSYNTVMDYIGHCRESANKVNTIRQKLLSLNYYFDYLKIPENPVRQIQLKGQTHSVPSRLLSEKELTAIYESYPSGGLVQKRTKVMLSLAVYQGVTNKELGIIEAADVKLQEGTIYVPKSRSANSRTLELRPGQLLLMQEYLLKTRPALLKESSKSTSRLFFSMGQGADVNKVDNVISILLYHLKPSNPKLRGLQQIRQSRITLWIDQYGLRQAQYMAGHRYVSSTERYKQDQTEGLRNELNKHHPLSGNY